MFCSSFICVIYDFALLLKLESQLLQRLHLNGFTNPDILFVTTYTLSSCFSHVCQYFLGSIIVFYKVLIHETPTSPQTSLECHKLGGKQIPRRLYAGDNSWRLGELVVQLAVQAACPLFGDWHLMSCSLGKHRGVLWERVKSMRSVRRRRLRVPELEPQG